MTGCCFYDALNKIINKYQIILNHVSIDLTLTLHLAYITFVGRENVFNVCIGMFTMTKQYM